MPGWKTDRGRIYIILGEPNDINRMTSKGELYDCEIWFYQGKTDMGLPPGFNLLFFREGGTGDYQALQPDQRRSPGPDGRVHRRARRTITRPI